MEHILYDITDPSLPLIISCKGNIPLENSHIKTCIKMVVLYLARKNISRMILRKFQIYPRPGNFTVTGLTLVCQMWLILVRLASIKSFERAKSLLDRCATSERVLLQKLDEDNNDCGLDVTFREMHRPRLRIGSGLYGCLPVYSYVCVNKTYNYP